MESARIRQVFLEFFASKGHKIVPSAPMVVKDDPTLMFNNAGMNPFKDLFLGNQPIVHARISDSQKCLRVSGKHNDLEEVGVDTYHHTMFEMLGNWSFGDYFKKEAIDWAWELLTKEYGLDPDLLYVTIFEGDKKDGLPVDEEARQLWLEHVPAERVIECDKKDNFWEMGETGPCGPCSEIHVDLRDAEARKATPGRELVNADHPQVVEIWNLVFMQFDRMANGSLQPLPAQHIDTGMGFERLAMALQGKQSNYDTDVFSPLLARVAELSGKRYGATDNLEDVAFRVISDHIRAVSFSIADGQLPSNTGAGYVIRRILRRAIRYGFSFLDMKQPFMHLLAATLADQLGKAFPELLAQQSLIQRVILEEEEAFLRTLDKGMTRLEALMESTPDSEPLAGKAIFELYDTFGFPVDLTALIASETGTTIDESGFQKELLAQKERSRAAGKITADDWVDVHGGTDVTFVGYDENTCESRILKYREVEAKKKKFYQIVLDRTPFYPEGGGQVGDAGTLRTENGKALKIFDTKRENNLVVHFATELPTDPSASFQAAIDPGRRARSQRNHSATHLMHEALRSILGDHVEQKGSLVKPDALRFDFSHFSKMSSDEIQRVEDAVNARILANEPLQEHRDMSLADAQAAGAMMLFGEKYGDKVRLIQFGSSKELCGGTHVNGTGAIGPFRIVSESAIAAGIRRIEAITGEAALASSRANKELLDTIQSTLKVSANIEKSIQDLLDKQDQLTAELDRFKKTAAGKVKQDIIANLEERGGVHFVAQEVELDPSAIKDLAFQLKAEHVPFLGVFGSRAGGKTTISIAISDDLVADRGMHAGNMVRELAKEIGGGGGGQPFFATAGGKNSDGLSAALTKAAAYLA